METAEEVVAPAPYNINDLCYTVARGKRTKRKRPHSPISFSHRLSPSLSAASMAADTTAAEEDTARSLILLSRGHFHHQGLQLCDYPTQNNRRPQTAAGRGGGAITGVGVYACKTCDRVFSSFQALGGHRTSHNKPKNDRRTTPFPDSIDDSPPPSSLSLQLSTTVTAGGGGGRRLSSPKTHECSYCGAEFPSGQALGGHMRRHRAGPTSPAASGVAEGKPPEPKKSRNGLSLDLNFPAPEDENERFEYGGARRKESPDKLVISATTPTLVDCHY